jgi:hypothetical protein
MQITRNSLDTNPGPGDWFTGNVFIDTVANPTPPSRAAAALVHFTPSARTAGTHDPVPRATASIARFGRTHHVRRAHGDDALTTRRCRLRRSVGSSAATPPPGDVGHPLGMLGQPGGVCHAMSRGALRLRRRTRRVLHAGCQRGRDLVRMRGAEAGLQLSQPDTLQPLHDNSGASYP